MAPLTASISIRCFRRDITHNADIQPGKGQEKSRERLQAFLDDELLVPFPLSRLRLFPSCFMKSP